LSVTGTIRTVEPPRIYRIDTLSEISGFSPRQIRRMIEFGAIPACHGRGPSAYYTDLHLNCLVRIRREREQRRTYADYAELIS
jgi:hypothetical protein